MQKAQATVDPSEIAKFEAMAAEWWDPQGKFKPLHMLNPTRLDYILSQIAGEFGCNLRAPRPLEGLRILDIGCGGGLLTEPLARLGASVTGIDAGGENLATAAHHAEQGGLQIAYRQITAEELTGETDPFDVVICMEVIEHVADPAALCRAACALARPGGLVLFSTLNRTPQSYLKAILGAERVMGWLPPGTHEWSKFIRPSELYGMLEKAGLRVVDEKGFAFDPVRWSWSLSDRDLSVNYAMTCVKDAE